VSQTPQRSGLRTRPYLLIGVIVLYDIQKVEKVGPGKRGRRVLVTDLVTSNKQRIFDRVKELDRRRQQCRVVPQYGPILEAEEVIALDR
jgi:hypothetical protein